MRDVSCRFLGELANTVRARGLAIDALLEELGIREETLGDVHEFVTWEQAAAFFTACQELVGGPQAMRELSRTMTDPKNMDPVVASIFRLAIGPRQLYSMLGRWAGPGAFNVVDAEISRLSGGRMELVVRVPPSRVGCPAFFHGNAGFLEAAPRFLGLGDSVVEADVDPHVGRYVITPPPSKSIFTRLRRLLGLLRGSDAALIELQAQHEAVAQQRAELEATRSALDQSEQRFTSVFQASPVPMVIAPEEGHVLLDVNAHFLEVLGMSREQALSTPIFDLPIWPSRSTAEAARAAGLGESGKPFDVAFQDSEGRERHGIATTSRSKLRDQPILLAQVLDVTERYEAERALESNEARHRAIVQAVPDVILLFGRDGRCRDAHVPAEAADGLSLDDPLGCTFEELGAPLEDAPRIRELIRRVSETGSPEACGLPLHGPGASRGFEARFARCDADSVIAILRDVTERDELEEQLRQSQKMEALGQLAGGVAHDFNNLLTAIIGYAEIQQGAVEPESTAAQAAQQILAASERAASLTRQLLTFSRRRIVDSRRIDLNDVVRGLLELLGRLIGEDIEIRTELCDGPAMVLGDPVEIEQVLMNLALNARDAMPKGGSLHLSTRHVPEEPDAHGVPRHAFLLLVRDTGTGMEAAVRERAFEPFFTTKPSGQATGLGLATVYGAVERLGGSVQIDSEPGHGTTVEVCLAATEVTEALPIQRDADGPFGRGETVLVVEDEEPLRNLLGTALADEGYQVLLASDGIEALELTELRGGEIDALVTDAVMPRMGGIELFTTLRKSRPEIPALFISGYPDRTVPSTCRVLAKPFRMKALGRSVREMLDERV